MVLEQWVHGMPRGLEWGRAGGAGKPVSLWTQTQTHRGVVTMLPLGNIYAHCCHLFKLLRRYQRDFPGGPVAKTACSQSREPRFDPWSGNRISYAATEDPACCN